MPGVGLVLGRAVEIDELAAQLDGVAGERDHALADELVGGDGLAQDHDVAARDRAQAQGDLVEDRAGADGQGGIHRGGGDRDGLEDVEAQGEEQAEGEEHDAGGAKDAEHKGSLVARAAAVKEARGFLEDYPLQWFHGSR